MKLTDRIVQRGGDRWSKTPRIYADATLARREQSTTTQPEPNQHSRPDTGEAAASAGPCTRALAPESKAPHSRPTAAPADHTPPRAASP